MLVRLVLYKRSVTAAYIKYRRNVLYKRDTIKIANVLYYHDSFFTYIVLFMLLHKQHLTLNRIFFFENEVFYSQVRFIMVANNCVSIMVLYCL